MIAMIKTPDWRRKGEVNIRIKSKVHKKLKVQAAKSGKTLSELIEFYVDAR